MRRNSSSSLRIAVLGYLVRGPLGGHAWHHLHYAAGLARLGHDVWFVEDSDDYPSCYDPERDVTDTDPTYGLAFARDAFARIGLPDRWAYHDAHSKRWFGPGADGAPSACASADVVLNLSGANPVRPWTERVGTRVFIDTDPGFTQATHLADDAQRARAAQHTAFFTFAENIATSATLPQDGFSWRPTRQPIVLDLWPVQPPAAGGAFTTVMLWDSYPESVAGGITLGLKSRSFESYLDLPSRVNAQFELAVGGSAPRELLRDHGWRVIDPRGPTRSLDTYQAYIASSIGEFGVAKHGYVTTHSGWFSERSANYLASGRPVITQDTGFSEVLPSGDGLLAFSSPDEALDHVAEVTSRYTHHAASARDVAEQCFDSRIVLTRLLEQALNG